MKIQILLFAFIGILLIACTEESPEDPLDVYRNIAYTALSPAQKASVLGDWQKAEVSAWIDAQILAGTPPFNGFTYAGAQRTSCERDIGYMRKRRPFEMSHYLHGK